MCFIPLWLLCEPARVFFFFLLLLVSFRLFSNSCSSVSFRRQRFSLRVLLSLSKSALWFWFPQSSLSWRCTTRASVGLGSCWLRSCRSILKRWNTSSSRPVWYWGAAQAAAPMRCYNARPQPAIMLQWRSAYLIYDCVYVFAPCGVFNVLFFAPMSRHTCPIFVSTITFSQSCQHNNSNIFGPFFCLLPTLKVHSHLLWEQIGISAILLAFPYLFQVFMWVF